MWGQPLRLSFERRQEFSLLPQLRQLLRRRIQRLQLLAERKPHLAGSIPRIAIKT